MSTTATATRLPVGTRVMVVSFAPDQDGLTGLVSGYGTGEWEGWTWVALDRRGAGAADLGYRHQYLVALPEPTVSLVKATYTCVACGETVPVAHQPEHCDAHDVPAAGQLTDRQERLAAGDRVAELETALTRALDRNTELRTSLEGQLARTEAARARLAEDLSDTQARTSHRIATLEHQLERAADIAVEKAVQLTETATEAAELRAALRRANDRAQTASDAAESYRQERDAARATIDAVARLVDPQDS